MRPEGLDGLPNELAHRDETYQEEFEDEFQQDEFQDLEDLFDVDAREEGTLSPVKSLAELPESNSKSKTLDSLVPRQLGKGSGRRNAKSRTKSNLPNGLKKSSLKKSKALDMPPTPLGCEWREAEGGWSLWRCWWEKDEVMGGRYKKDRYVGYLSREAWQVMKDYDYETFISVIGQRFRRHSGR